MTTDADSPLRHLLEESVSWKRQERIPASAPRRTRLCHETHFQTSGRQQHRIINLCCLQPLRFLSSVRTQPQGTSAGVFRALRSAATRLGTSIPSTSAHCHGPRTKQTRPCHCELTTYRGRPTESKIISTYFLKTLEKKQSDPCPEAVEGLFQGVVREGLSEVVTFGLNSEGGE